MECWCKVHKNEILQGGKILEIEDLESQECDHIISFEPLSYQWPESSKTNHEGQHSDTRLSHLNDSLKAFQNENVNSVISSVMPDNLSEMIDNSLFKCYQKTFLSLTGVVFGGPSGKAQI